MPSIEARITRVYSEEGSEWTRIETDHERVKRLDTRNKELAREAASLKDSGDLLLIDYTEKPGKNINPHTNQPYLNRYYEKAGPISSRDGDGIEIVPAAAGRKTDPTDAWRMTLAKAGELAVATVGNLPEPIRTKEVVLDFGLQQNIALAWARLIYFSTPPQASDNFTPGNGGVSFQGVDPGGERPPLSDEDVPF